MKRYFAKYFWRKRIYLRKLLAICAHLVRFVVLWKHLGETIRVLWFQKMMNTLRNQKNLLLALELIFSRYLLAVWKIDCLGLFSVWIVHKKKLLKFLFCIIQTKISRKLCFPFTSPKKSYVEIQAEMLFGHFSTQATTFWVPKFLLWCEFSNI